VGPAGASGAGSNVVRQGALFQPWQAMLSTQASGGGAHLSHVGTFDVYVRVQVPAINVGEVSIALEYAYGDFFSVTTNAAYTFEVNDAREGQWVIVPLGLVTIPKAQQGTQRWEGRIIGRSTVAGDDIDLDYLFLVPCDAGSATAQSVQQATTPTTFSARDEFDHAAGALAGKVAPVGGTWAGAGAATDFTVEVTGHTAQHTTAPLAPGRYAIIGATNYTNIIVQVDCKVSAHNTGWRFVFARYVDTSNWIAVGEYVNTGDVATGVKHLHIFLRVGGVDLIGFTDADSVTVPANVGVYQTFRLQVMATGTYYGWSAVQGQPLGSPLFSGWHSSLATGGALATGKPGFYDERAGSSAVTRNFDNFWAATPTTDAAVYAGQSLAVTHSGAERENAAGITWNRVANYEGTYDRPGPSGAEGRTLRTIIKPARFKVAGALLEPAIDDMSARRFVIPRYLNVPSA